MPGRSIKFFMNAKFGGVPPVTKAGYSKAPTGFGGPIFKAPVLTAWSWAGPYIGANIGYSAGKSKTDAVFSDFTTGAPLLATGSTDNLNGMIGGIQGGYNWQGGNWVGGIEADIQIAGQGATPSYLCPGAVCNPGIADFTAPVTASFDQGHKLDSFGTLRGRFGTTITPDVMVYATGGLAVGSIRSTVRLAGVGFDADGNPGAVSNAVSVLTSKGGMDGRRRPRGSPVRQRDRKDRVPPHGLRHHLDVRHQSIQRDPGYTLQQFPHHRQHRARRSQLQARPCAWCL